VKLTEVVLVSAVIALAGFVGVQATVQTAPAAQSDAFAAPPVATPAPGEAASITRDGSSTQDATPRAPANDRALDLTTGSAREGRVAYVSDVPRPPALAAAELQRRLNTGSAGTYIDALLSARDSVLTRWPDRLLTPVRVWIGDGAMHDAWDPEFPSLVREAFEAWAATGIPMRFTFVRDSSDVDVRVRFVPSFADGISGRTVWSRDANSWLVSGEIDLSLRHPRGDAVSRAQLQAIALHEIGHLLGLDHVDDPEHIMAPRVRARTLSDGDIATVRLLYSVPAGSARH
jgi:hypothetical protein